ncbi:MAG TPA: alpha/beta hydrolase [Acetobacteraceae bacterium]|nr:alpha/beta hydrolase [Acetobacteraceae bacterium]
MTLQGDTPRFSEGFVEADGFRIRYMAAGEGLPLVHLHGAGGTRLTPVHNLLARQHRVIAFEMPGFGRSAENTRTTSTAALAETMGTAIRALGIERCNLWATSFGARVALWLAARQPALASALVLEAPAAIRLAGQIPPSGSPEEIARMIYAHPERQPPMPAPDPAAQIQARAFVMRVRGPDREADLEAAMRRMETPVLVLFGTRDALMPPELGRYYKEMLPNGHLVFVYDAGHAISTERPEAFVEVTGDFLERHEAFVINRVGTVKYP